MGQGINDYTPSLLRIYLRTVYQNEGDGAPDYHVYCSSVRENEVENALRLFKSVAFIIGSK